ncbi:uncharacterized protein RCO7_03410 [Rhynchosporium graminicola]|uniref:Dynamin GTPase domain-containing protein n=1 Tax=Rhynchosporium graminicola TaxID=2792576 RepID=A0A1E1LS90_9HELO|nr:uncharacterized protein RCO7_03410 [Rhynchosporium commune]
MGEITPPKAVPGLAEQISEKTSGFIHSRKHRDLLDIVDALRSNGVSHYVNLPQIISCGSQSSGKSSTLESFSGIAFPTAEGLCTRFATEVILRRSEKSETKVQIQLSASRSEEERVKLLKFHEKETDQKYFAKIIEAAKIEMGLTGTGPDAKVFSIDILRIESTSPTAPNLTLVDLPGLFSASDKNQHAFANQPVTKFAREIDPSGIRTLGLITKPDKIDRGSDTEKLDALDPAQLGVSALRDRLREVLWKQIEGAMPGVKYDVQLGIKDCAFKLNQLGKSRSTSKEKHRYLHQISGNVSTIIQTAIDGVYADPFFVSYPGQQDAFDRRLRANIQRILTIYAGKMVLHGHALEIVEDDLTPIRRTNSSYIMRSSYLEIVKELLAESRGRELPGTFNPLVIGDLFSRQCKPWEYITQNLAEQGQRYKALTRAFEVIAEAACGFMTKSAPDTLDDTEDNFDINLRRLLQKLQDRTRPEWRNTPFLWLPMWPQLTTRFLSRDSSIMSALMPWKRVSSSNYQKCKFSPDVAWELSDEQVELLGSEDDRTVTERAELQKKKAILTKALIYLDAVTARCGARGYKACFLAFFTPRTNSLGEQRELFGSLFGLDTSHVMLFSAHWIATLRFEVNIWLQDRMRLTDVYGKTIGDWIRMMPILADLVQVGPEL